MKGAVKEMNTNGTVYAPVQLEEITPKYRSGMFWLVLNIVLTLASIGLMMQQRLAW